MLTKAILFAAALLVLDGRTVVAQSSDSRMPEAGDTSRHRLGMVTVNGVRVPYLDWGGSGPALVFIPGMGGTAHVFDDFAPRFVDQFRVVGVTRIGFGESDQPEREGYDLASRVAHIRAVLDALGIARATLIGHSLGGDEITAFAVAGLRRMRDTSKATAGIHANTVSPEFGKVQAPVLALYSDVSASFSRRSSGRPPVSRPSGLLPTTPGHADPFGCALQRVPRRRLQFV
jgi:pimeloyl-ACP methyl ester carboxylesterase